MLKIFGRFTKLPAILLAVLVLLIFLHYFGLLLPLENVVVRIFNPIQHSFYVLGVKINNFYSSNSFQKDLAKNNLELEEKIRTLLIENAQLRVLAEEKESGREQTNFLAKAGLAAITAKVVGRNLQSDFQTVILDKGSNDGVAVNLPVVAENGVIVGKVVEVGKNNCQILLVNDGHSSLAATIQNQEKTKGVVVGQRGLSLKMEMIPQDELINVGEMVITSGLEASIPRGLIIGQIEQVIVWPNSLFQEVFLKTLINLDDLVVVSIVRPNQND